MASPTESFVSTPAAHECLSQKDQEKPHSAVLEHFHVKLNSAIVTGHDN